MTSFRFPYFRVGFDAFEFVRTAIVDDNDRFVSDMQEAKTAIKVLPPHILVCGKSLHNIAIKQAWEDSLPEHLRYTEENLHIMASMYETPANTGPWCFFYMHALHSCCEMSASSVRFLVVFPTVSGSRRQRTTASGTLPYQEVQRRFGSGRFIGRFIVPRQASDAGDRCLRILKSVGTRAKNLHYLGEYINL